MDVNYTMASDIQFGQTNYRDAPRLPKSETGSPTVTARGSGGSAELKPNGDRSLSSIQEFEDNLSSADDKSTSDFLQKMIDKANKHLSSSNHELSYSVHEKTGQFMIKIIDVDTKEVVREVPPEKTLDAVAKMWEMAGILIDEKK